MAGAKTTVTEHFLEGLIDLPEQVSDGVENSLPFVPPIAMVPMLSDEAPVLGILKTLDSVSPTKIIGSGRNSEL